MPAGHRTFTWLPGTTGSPGRAAGEPGDDNIGGTDITENRGKSRTPIIKALELPWSTTLGDFLKLRKGRLFTDTVDNAIQQYYELLESVTAQRVVRFMQVRRADSAH